MISNSPVVCIAISQTWLFHCSSATHGLLTTIYGTAHLQGNECTRETRVQLSSNSRATLVYTQSYSQSSIQQKPVKITNCWLGENVNDWITLHLSASVLFRKMRSIDRNDGRFRLTICIVLGEIRLN